MNYILEKILAVLLVSPKGITRTEICEIIKIPRTTVYDNLVKLQKQGRIEKFSRSSGRRGRPIVLWKLKM